MSASAVTIRDARDDERAAIEQLTLAAYAEYATIMEPSGWRALDQAVRSALRLNEPAERIVAEQDGRIIGSVLLFEPSDTMYDGAVSGASAPELRLLAVAPEARGAGLGEALVAECIRRARRAGAAELGLHSSDSLVAALRLYERLGFVRAPEHDFQPDGAELVKGYRLVLDT